MNRIILFVILSTLLFSCKNLLAPTEPNLDYSAGRKLDTSRVYTLTGLRNADVHITKINKDYQKKETDIGRLELISSSKTSKSNSFSSPPIQEEKEIAVVHERSQEFNNSPPEELAQTLRARKKNRYLYPATSPDYKTGDTRSFFVEKGNAFIEIQAVLMDVGERCYIWVPVENYDTTGGSTPTDNKISDTQIQSIKNKFDKMYPYMTTIFGYEYWFDVKNNSYGRNIISILLYDIDYNYTPSQNSGVVGYFWAKDYAPRSQTSVAPSNELEMFYIDVHMMDRYPDVVYSTLIHEFQHMINFNAKIIHAGLRSVETWFNEMLSMMAEDVIYPMIASGDVKNDAGWVINQRIPEFNRKHALVGVTEWRLGSFSAASYAQACAFGAFLTRNYGDVDIIMEIMSNQYQGTLSIGHAVKRLYPNLYVEPTTAFSDLLVRYAEVLLYDSAIEGRSFNKTVTTSKNGYTYTFRAFNLWNDFPTSRPVFKSLATYEPIPGYGFNVFSEQKLSNVTGSVSIRVTLPALNNIDYYLYVVPTK
ncbi:MAG: M30 family zinc metallopeptidase [Treponemataceae bacterium]